ncbi:MAG: effector-associated constant component EACC1 [Stackebrandtia sp.]
MEITIQCAGAKADEDLLSLARWLEVDYGVRRHVRITHGTTQAAVPGQQGDVIDLIALVLSSGFSGASLAVAIASWRDSRSKPTTLTFERADGRKVELSGDLSANDLAEMIRSVVEE